MILKQISLKNFRHFENQEFGFNPFLTIIIGENARGKTNLLEAIYFIVNGIGFRESREEELLRWNVNNGEVAGVFKSGDELINFNIHLRKNDYLIDKIYLLNKTKKKHWQYLKETTKTVLFSPENIEIIIGTPEVRRNYFNRLISIYDPEYKKRLINYENALRKRNKILEVHQEENKLKEQLVFWNNYLEQQAIYLTSKRQAYVDFLNKHQQLDSLRYSLVYLKNEFSKKRAEDVFQTELRYRRTIIGPQKDDFQVEELVKDFKKNLQHFGSRSEQRLAVFWLKLNEILFYEESFSGKPILLLDDIFSELDHKNKKLVLDLIRKYQTIITTTENELLELIDIPKSVIEL
jgi:DNA replication and repair protein RecF